jgi:hypothetical protein
VRLIRRYCSIFSAGVELDALGLLSVTRLFAEVKRARDRAL